VHLDRPAMRLWLLPMTFIARLAHCIAARTQANRRSLHVANLKSRAAAAALLASTVIAPSSAAPLNVTYFAPVPNASDNLGTVDLGTNIISGSDSDTCMAGVSTCGGPSAKFQLTLPIGLQVDSVIFELTRLGLTNADFTPIGGISFSWKPYIQVQNLTATGATADLITDPVDTSPLAGFNVGYTVSQVTANQSYGLSFGWRLSIGVSEAPADVPLPPSLALTVVGLAMLGAVRRTRRRRLG